MADRNRKVQRTSWRAELWDELPVIFNKAQEGFDSLNQFVTFLKEKSKLDTQYAKSLKKLVTTCKLGSVCFLACLSVVYKLLCLSPSAHVSFIHCRSCSCFTLAVFFPQRDHCCPLQFSHCSSIQKKTLYTSFRGMIAREHTDSWNSIGKSGLNT